MDQTTASTTAAEDDTDDKMTRNKDEIRKA